MGSFAVQQYLLDHSAEVDGVVLTGTAAIDLLEPALDLDQPLDLAVFNAAFQPARTDYDWLSRDERLKSAGLTDVTVRIYPGARHEILNETDRDEVIAALNSWLDRVVTSSDSGPLGNELTLTPRLHQGPLG
jgi:alpha-beta hydrolase superfamily lysophospholipase